MDLARHWQRNSADDVLRTAGGALLAIAAVLSYVRMEDDWAAFPLLVIVAIPWLYFLGLALSEPWSEGLSPWRTAYLGGAALLTPLVLFQLAHVLGESNPGTATGTGVAVATAAIAGWISLRNDSSLNALIAALAGGAAALFATDWIDDDAGATAFRNVLIGVGVLYFVAGVALRGARAGHSSMVLAAAALALIIAASIGLAGEDAYLPYLLYGLSLFVAGDGNGGGGWGWGLLIVASAVAMIVVAARDRGNGSSYVAGYVALLGLSTFLFAEASGDKLTGWPLALGIAAVVLLAASFRAGTRESG